MSQTEYLSIFALGLMVVLAFVGVGAMATHYIEYKRWGRTRNRRTRTGAMPPAPPKREALDGPPPQLDNDRGGSEILAALLGWGLGVALLLVFCGLLVAKLNEAGVL